MDEEDEEDIIDDLPILLINKNASTNPYNINVIYYI